MLKNGMYVRCSIDSDEKNPRDFALGKVTLFDDFSQKVNVEFFDCNDISKFYPMDDMKKSYSSKRVVHCKIKTNARIMYNDDFYIVKESKKNEDEYFYYYIQNSIGIISIVCEKDIIATFNDGYINPIKQLINYEFQNPMWFLGRSIVSKTMNIINNSLYGFKELAGCKIMLKPHQIKTVMRCLKNNNCRYMIADEVGLGKTIEAICILKIYLLDKHNQKVLITVPDSLIEQWRTELAFKFKLFNGNNINDNFIDIIGISNICNVCSKYDFIIVDEVHRYLENINIYNAILKLSIEAKNILMLSATPVQKRNEEYKKLLSLIQPARYLNMDNDVFNKLLDSQNKLIRIIYNVLDEFDAYNESIESNDGVINEESKENFESTVEELNKLKNIINDSYFDELLKNIELSSNDYGYESIQNCIAYVCENYQMEKSVIRNRRKKINLDENINNRVLVDISYEVDNNFNSDEWNTYKLFSDWIENVKDSVDFKSQLMPVIASLFSSGPAFLDQIYILNEIIPVNKDLLEYANKYAKCEKNRISHITSYLDDPSEFSCKLVNVIDYIDQECEGKKILLFTSFQKTFDLYKEALIFYFGDECCCFFNKQMAFDDLELNVYKFQNYSKCNILLSDESGGEGRNFQTSDVLIHLDIPWSANDLEQRIGRLDRIGRDKSKDVVSVVCYGKGTTDESLFKLWNDGINIFRQSQSGLEIIMNDIDNQVIYSLKKSFKYGLDSAKFELENVIKTQTDSLKKEQIFDIAAYQYQDLNKILDKTINKFNNNETSLFGTAMMSWASLSGFRGTRDNDDTVTFSINSMSIKSMCNTMFIPPNMKALIDDKLNQLRNRIRALANDKKKIIDNSYIRGTFSRNRALANDYLNFFAPGDDIFDCITNNALSSYKGTCAAFACKGKINWSGFVFTWKIKIDEKIFYDNNLSALIINQFKGFIPSDLIITPYNLSSNDIDDDLVISEFNRVINNNVENYNSISHFGKRSGGILEKFKNEFPRDIWKNLVDEAYKSSIENARNHLSLSKRKPLLSLKKTLLNEIGAEKSISKFYNTINNVEQVKKINEVIYSVISKSTIVLDSVCYVVINDE